MFLSRSESELLQASSLPPVTGQSRSGDEVQLIISSFPVGNISLPLDGKVGQAFKINFIIFLNIYKSTHAYY